MSAVSNLLMAGDTQWRGLLGRMLDVFVAYDGRGELGRKDTNEGEEIMRAHANGLTIYVLAPERGLGGSRTEVFLRDLGADRIGRPAELLVAVVVSTGHPTTKSMRTRIRSAFDGKVSTT